MPDEHDATNRQFILRSLGYIEQGRLQHFEIRYFIDDKEIEITIKGWEKYDPKKANAIWEEDEH